MVSIACHGVVERNGRAQKTVATAKYQARKYHNCKKCNPDRGDVADLSRT